MPFMDWAIHMIQWWLQKEAWIYILANLKKLPKFELDSEIGFHEVGIASNRLS